jgi:hypothetical protein
MDPITQELQPQNLNTPELPAPHRHFLNKNFLVMFVVLLVLGGGVYAYVWQYQSNLASQEIAPTYTSRADSMVDWKTYTNTEYGFEFKYPASLYNKTDKYGPIALESTPLRLLMGGALPNDAGIKGKDYTNDGYRIFATTREKNKVVIDLTTSVPDSYTSTKINIPGAVAYRIDDTGGVTCGPQVLINAPAVPDKYVELGYCAQTDYPVDPLFNQILSTFKLTTPITISNWQKYTNIEDYKFSVRYPLNWKYTLKKDGNGVYGINFIGPEGEFSMIWGNGFGGNYCSSPDDKDYSFPDTYLSGCRSFNPNGSESFVLFKDQIISTTAKIAGYTNSVEGNELVDRILSTLQFPK